MTFEHYFQNCISYITLSVSKISLKPCFEQTKQLNMCIVGFLKKVKLPKQLLVGLPTHTSVKRV